MSADCLGEDMIKKISRCSRLHSALGVVKKTQLIQCVRDRPCLWDHKCSDFKFATARQNAFLDIVKEMSDEQHQYTRSQMQEEWGKIRYCFTRIMKKVISTNDDADAISWPHWEDMQFMYDLIKENLLNNGDYGDSEHRKRRKTRASVYFKRLRSGDSGRKGAHSAEEASDTAGTAGEISTATAQVLYHLGAGEQRLGTVSTTTVRIKSEDYPRSISTGDEDNYEEPSASGSVSVSVSPATFGQSTAVHPSSSSHDTFRSSMYDNGQPSTTSGTRSSAQFTHQFPNSSFSATTSALTLGDALLSGTAAQDYRNNTNLPSVESADVAARSDGEKDNNDFFGTYMIQQMKSVARRNPTLGVLLRKELMEVCCKYELQTFS